MYPLGRGIVNSAENATKREWLVTNGMGGFASGTISGALTRGYHGLLVAALKPPLGRTLLVSKLDETIILNQGEQNERSFALFTNTWSKGSFFDEGYKLLDSFHLSGTIPVWTYALDNALIEKRVWMQQGENTTYVSYTLTRSSKPVTFKAKAIVNYRDYHSTTRANSWQMTQNPVENGLEMLAYEDATPFYLLSQDATFSAEHNWYRNYYLAVEDYRGETYKDDNLNCGEFHATLAEGDTITLVLSTEPAPILDGASAYAAQQAHERRILENVAFATHKNEKTDLAEQQLQQLLLAADQFIVARATSIDPDGRSVIAGYPWFGDWGRDTMVALPGLTITTGRYEVAEKLLRTYARFINEGMLPNRFPDGKDEDAPEYNTVDASLWYFEAIRAYHAATGDFELVRDLFPKLQEIITWYRLGTRYRIQLDEGDGLIYAGEPGVQLTWMDAKVDNWVVTPRTGKPIEINALWYNALCIMNEFAQLLGSDDDQYQTMAARARQGFNQFWNSSAGYCYDVIGGPSGSEAALRPNQILAVSLPHSPLPNKRRKAVVDACAEHLLTPHGLRTLARFEHDYHETYGGNRVDRDSSYHQGTVWGWLIGPFVAAHLLVYNDAKSSQSYLYPLLNHLNTGCVGNMSEIFDASPPFAPRGCFAQAWTVAEVLRAWKLTESALAGEQMVAEKEQVRQSAETVAPIKNPKKVKTDSAAQNIDA